MHITDRLLSKTWTSFQWHHAPPPLAQYHDHHALSEETRPFSLPSPLHQARSPHTPHTLQSASKPRHPCAYSREEHPVRCNYPIPDAKMDFRGSLGTMGGTAEGRHQRWLRHAMLEYLCHRLWREWALRRFGVDWMSLPAWTIRTDDFMS